MNSAISKISFGCTSGKKLGKSVGIEVTYILLRSFPMLACFTQKKNAIPIPVENIRTASIITTIKRVFAVVIDGETDRAVDISLNCFDEGFKVGRLFGARVG